MQSRKAFVPFKILLIGDSRLSGFHQLIINELHDKHAWDIHVDTLVFPGADIQGTVDKTLENIGCEYYDLIYVATGVNELSYKRKYKTIVPVFTYRYGRPFVPRGRME